MAGAYLEIIPRNTYLFQANVLLNDAAVELYQSVLWFQARPDSSGGDASNADLFINLVSTGGNIAISNNGTSTNSLVNVTLTRELTANLAMVNSAFWSLVVKTAANAVYTLDQGRMAVLSPLGSTY